MNRYESMVIFHGDLPAETAGAQNQAIVDLIKAQGGELLNADEWGKRRLAYPIKRATEGYYVVYTYHLDPKNLPEIERHYRLAEEIIRYNILVKEQGV